MRLNPEHVATGVEPADRNRRPLARLPHLAGHQKPDLFARDTTRRLPQRAVVDVAKRTRHRDGRWVVDERRARGTLSAEMVECEGQCGHAHLLADSLALKPAPQPRPCSDRLEYAEL